MLQSAWAELPTDCSTLKQAGHTGGALKAFARLPVQFTIGLRWADHSEQQVPIRFAGSGASRVVYASCDPAIPLAFKFAHSKYSVDDNQQEFHGSLALPSWLIVGVHGFCEIVIQGETASVLVISKMWRTLEELACPSDGVQDLLRYARAVLSTWRLLARVAADTDLACHDWNSGNLMVPDNAGDGQCVRLVDWAGTLPSGQGLERDCCTLESTER